MKGLVRPHLEKDIGTQFEDTLASVDLYESGLTGRFPNIRWVVGHLGGAVSFLAGRLDEHWERDKAVRALATAPTESFGNVYFDTAGHDATAVRFAIERLGADRFVYGSDFPMVGYDGLADLVSRTRVAIAAPEYELIAADTPLALVGRHHRA